MPLNVEGYIEEGMESKMKEKKAKWINWKTIALK